MSLPITSASTTTALLPTEQPLDDAQATGAAHGDLSVPDLAADAEPANPDAGGQAEAEAGHDTHSAAGARSALAWLLELAPPHAIALLTPLKTGPQAPAHAAAKPRENPTDSQRAQDALKAGAAPPATHPRMKHVREVQERLKREGLPSDAEGVRVYVVGDSADHGAMVVRTIAGPAGLGQKANVEFSEKMPDLQQGRLPDEGERADRAIASLSVKMGDATVAQLQRWAVDSLEAAYTQPKAELDYLVAHAPNDGQTKIVNMSWGSSKDALVAEATRAALGNAESPLVKQLNERRAAADRPPLDLSKPQDKEELRQSIAGLIEQAVRAPAAVRRIDAARIEATRAVAQARAAGFLPIAAAGNFFEPGRTGERSNTNENLVATIPGVLSVGSVTLDATTKPAHQAMAPSSSMGAATSAPGVDVPVGIHKQTGAATDVSGTSFAAPYAASVAALMVKANPNITPAQIEKILQGPAATRDVKGTQRDGAGVIDPVAAVREAKALLKAGAPAFGTSQNLEMAVRRAAYDTLRVLLPTTSPTYKAAVDLINDNHFVALDPATQKQLLAGLATGKADRALVDDVARLVASKPFNELGPAARARFAQTFVAHEPADRRAAMALLERRDITSLPTTIKDAVTTAAAKSPSDATTVDALVKRANDPAFKKLPADAQAAFFRAFEHQHDTFEIDPAPAHKQSLLALVDSAAFKQLDATAQSRWLLALASPDAAHRERSYERLDDVVQRTAKQSDADKASALNSRAGALDAPDMVRNDRVVLPGASKEEPQIVNTQDERRSVFLNYKPGGGIDPKKADVTVHTVLIEDKAIEVIYPRPLPAGLPPVELIAKSLAGLPAFERGLIQQVIVDPRQKDFMQAVLAKDGHPNRVFMGGEVADNPLEMTATLSHEAAHLIAARRFKDEPAMRDQWQAAIQDDNKRVSNYATVSLQEDVAETIALYYQVKGTADEAVMERQFPHRFALVKQLLGEP